MSRCSCPNHSGFRLPRGVSRRDVLRYGLGGAGLVALGPWLDERLPVATGAPMGNKILVVLEMNGGCDTLNAVVPKTLGNYYSLRPSIQIPPGQELPLAGNSLYGFHPLMTNLKTMYDAGDVAVVHRAGYPDENLSHFESQDIYSYGVRDGFPALHMLPSGWIARYAERHAPTPLGAVSIGAGRPTSFIGGASNPIQVSSVGSFRFSGDGAFPANQVHRLNTVRSILAQSSTVGAPGEVKVALDGALGLSDQLQAALTSFQSVVTYPVRTPARALRDVAVLVQGGFETRVFFTTIGGFDTHGDQGAAAGGGLPTLLQDIDLAIEAFRQDMVAMGQWDNVVIAVITEFGRRNYENGSFGTDHGGAYEFLLVGGAVNGGFYGPDLTTGDLGDEYLTYAVDFRDVYKEIVNDHLGGVAAPIFPEPQPTNVVLGVV